MLYKHCSMLSLYWVVYKQSGSCGYGLQRRSVICVQLEGLQEVDSGLCSQQMLNVHLKVIIIEPVIVLIIDPSFVPIIVSIFLTGWNDFDVIYIYPFYCL